MSADEDLVGTISLQSSDDVLAGSVFGDAPSFWKVVVHEFDLQGFVLF